MSVATAEVTAGERRTLLRHPGLVTELHRRIWDEEDPKLAALWHLPL